MKTVEFLRQTCLLLENASLRLLVTQSVGPRLLALHLEGGENLFAEVPDATLECPGAGVFHFYGGHRLWHAPEEPQRTYQPDDRPVEISPLPDGLRVQQREEATGTLKTLEIHLPDERPRLLVNHVLTNLGLWPIPCAPWAITQFKTGGVAILPQPQAPTGPTPNRVLVLWPYTDLACPSLRWGNRYLLVQARMTVPLKIGFPNPRGWLGYWWNDALFVKRAPYDPQAVYYDSGSSSECYCNDRFLELETLGPATMLAPGESASHLETWELYNGVPRPVDEEAVQGLAETLHLEG